MTQAQLDLHNMTPQVTQEQIDLQNQLEMHTADLITKPLSNDSPILFLDTKETTDDPIQDQMEHQNIPEQQNISTILTKNKTPSDPDQSPDTPPPTKKKYEIMKDPAFLSSPIYPPIIPTKPQLSTTRDDYLVPILSNHRFSFKSQLTSLYMHPTDYTFKLYDKNQDFFTSIASKIMAPYHYWLHNGIKIFSLQFNFLRPSIYDLKTDENDPSFLSTAQKATHHLTYTRFLQHSKPQNYIFANYKYTSPFTMTNLYTIDHSKITGYLRNYDPIKQYFCLLPHNDTSRPLIIPQEYLIHFDDFLLPCNIPTQIFKPLTVIKHLVSTPLDDKDTSHYTALYKQSYSYNELLFIAAKVISYMVRTEQSLEIQTEQQRQNKTRKTPPPSPIKQTTSEKLTTILNNRTLKDLTQMLDPYKRNSSDSPITTLNHLIHCHNRTSQLLQTLDLDSQRITQSSQAIQSALESMNTLFNTLNIN